jgi:hypothetical protein
VGQARKKYTQEYKDEAVELVISSGRPIAEIARNLGINEGTLASWENRAKPQSTGQLRRTATVRFLHEEFSGVNPGAGFLPLAGSAACPWFVCSAGR